MVSRHNKLRNVFFYFCQRACLGPRLEMGCGAGSNSQSRPADVLVPHLGKPAGMHTHPSSGHLASLVECFLHSAAWAAAPEEVLASLKMAGVRG